MDTLNQLKKRLEDVCLIPVNTFEQQRQRDKVAFQIQRDIEILENPESYELNKEHWEGHELVF